MAFIFPIGLGGGFYAPARANTSLRSLPITCRGKKTPQYTKSSHKKKCCGIKEDLSGFIDEGRSGQRGTYQEPLARYCHKSDNAACHEQG